MRRAQREALTAAHGQLTKALLLLLDEGRRPPCHGDQGVLADEAEERAEAAAWCCPGCPVKDACFEAGRYEQFWGGVDRTQTGRNR